MTKHDYQRYRWISLVPIRFRRVLSVGVSTFPTRTRPIWKAPELWVDYRWIIEWTLKSYHCDGSDFVPVNVSTSSHISWINLIKDPRESNCQRRQNLDLNPNANRSPSTLGYKKNQMYLGIESLSPVDSFSPLWLFKSLFIDGKGTIKRFSPTEVNILLWARCSLGAGRLIY